MQVKNYDDSGKFLGSLARDAPVREMEWALITRDGKKLWQTLTVRALFGPDGNPAEYQVVGRDITERKEAEEELLRKNEELGASYEQILETVCSCGHGIWHTIYPGRLFFSRSPSRSFRSIRHP